MAMTDPIADMLTRIRNAQMAKHENVDMFSSKMKLSIAEILKDEGYILDYKELKEDKHNIIRIQLKYVNDGEVVIKNLERVSKPGRRVYVNAKEIPLTLRGYGVSILSTSKGVITDKKARSEKVGGEVLLRVW
jgi:small subunit ribosomal protein S8